MVEELGSGCSQPSNCYINKAGKIKMQESKKQNKKEGKDKVRPSKVDTKILEKVMLLYITF